MGFAEATRLPPSTSARRPDASRSRPRAARKSVQEQEGRMSRLTPSRTRNRCTAVSRSCPSEGLDGYLPVRRTRGPVGQVGPGVHTVRTFAVPPGDGRDSGGTIRGAGSRAAGRDPAFQRDLRVAEVPHRSHRTHHRWRWSLPSWPRPKEVVRYSPRSSPARAGKVHLEDLHMSAQIISVERSGSSRSSRAGPASDHPRERPEEPARACLPSC